MGETKEDSLPDDFQKPNALGEFITLEGKGKGTQVLKEETVVWKSREKKGATSPNIKNLPRAQEEVREACLS